MPSDGERRWAARTFALVVVVALPVILYQSRQQWFFLDEWDFLADRDPSSLDDLLRPHNEHWSTIPILLYRALYRVVGLHHYWPYQLMVVAAHLGAAVMLRTVMRRAGVHPWIATAGASLFALLGSGRQNIGWAFQIGFTGALLLGLLHLVLSDHRGPFDRRDAAGLACGFLALLFSGIGVTTAVVVGVATFVGRGWRPALLHTLPLATAFAVWFASYGRDSYSGAGSNLREASGFAFDAATATFDGLGQLRFVGLLLALILVGGAAVALVSTERDALRRRCAATAGLAAGAVVLLALTSYGRSGLDIGSGATASRYVHLLGAMILPAICVGATELTRRWPGLLAVTMVVLLAGLPGNVDALEPSGPELFTLGQPQTILVLPELIEEGAPPPGLEPYPFAADGVTVSWVSGADAAGRLPDPGRVPPGVRANAELALSLRQLPILERGCLPVAPDQIVSVERGQDILLPIGVTTVVRVIADRTSGTATYLGAAGDTMLRVEQGPLDLKLQPRTPGVEAEVCS